MEIKLYAMTCGHVTCDLGHLMAGGEGRIRIPIPAYLIQHSKGVALFDSGMHPDCQSDPAARVGVRMTGLFDFDYHPRRGDQRASDGDGPRSDTYRYPN